MVEVTKKDNEGNESLVRRFSRRVQESGVLIQARKVKFFEPKKNRRKVREDAQRRSELQAEHQRLVKLGEIDEFSPLPGKRRSRRR